MLKGSTATTATTTIHHGAVPVRRLTATVEASATPIVSATRQSSPMMKSYQNLQNARNLGTINPRESQ